MKGANEEKQVKKKKKTSLDSLTKLNLPQYTVLEIKERLWVN